MGYLKVFFASLVIWLVCYSMPVCAYDTSIAFDKTNIATWNQMKVSPDGFDENTSLILGNSDRTLGQAGCGIFATSSMLVKCGYMNPSKETPVDIAKKLNEDKANNFNTEEDSLWHFNPTRIGYLNDDLVCTSCYEDMRSKTTDEALAYIKELYYKGYFILIDLQVDGGTDGHYIFVDGYNGNEMYITDSSMDGTKWSDYYGKNSTHIKYLNVFKSKSGLKSYELPSVYGSSVTLSKTNSDGEEATTLSDGTVSTITVNPEKFLEAMQKVTEQCKEDYDSGKLKWVYTNRHNSKFVSMEADREAGLKGDKWTGYNIVRVNCAAIASFGLYEIGILDSSCNAFYMKGNGGISWSSATEKAIRKYCDVIENVNKTADQAIKDGTLQAGDIVGYYLSSGNHTNVYAGDGKWYDAGRGGGSIKLSNDYPKIQEEGSHTTYNGAVGVFENVGPAQNAVSTSNRISVIIRVKDITGALTDEENESADAVSTDTTSENSLQGMPEKFALADMQSQIILDSDLSNEEVRVVTIVRESMEDSNSFSLSGLLRLGVMMLGVGLMLYGVLLPIAYIFDRENRLFRFSMLGLLTAWRYKVDDGSVPLEMQKQDKKHKYMTVGRLVRKCVITEIVAFALVSGVVYKFVGMFILYIESIKGA